MAIIPMLDTRGITSQPVGHPLSAESREDWGPNLQKVIPLLLQAVEERAQGMYQASGVSHDTLMLGAAIRALALVEVMKTANAGELGASFDGQFGAGSPGLLRAMQEGFDSPEMKQWLDTGRAAGTIPEASVPPTPAYGSPEFAQEERRIQEGYRPGTGQDVTSMMPAYGGVDTTDERAMIEAGATPRSYKPAMRSLDTIRHLREEVEQAKQGVGRLAALRAQPETLNNLLSRLDELHADAVLGMPQAADPLTGEARRATPGSPENEAEVNRHIDAYMNQQITSALTEVDSTTAPGFRKIGPQNELVEQTLEQGRLTNQKLQDAAILKLVANKDFGLINNERGLLLAIQQVTQSVANTYGPNKPLDKETLLRIFQQQWNDDNPNRVLDQESQAFVEQVFQEDIDVHQTRMNKRPQQGQARNG
jgi:hypothetical protein